MNTKAKSNSVITHNVVGSLITFTVLGVGKIPFDTGNASSDCGRHAMIHGFIQRISDAAAISRDPETGEPATPQDKFDAMKRLVDHYESGTSEWSRKPIAGEGQKGGLLFKALCQMSPSKAPEEIRAWMDGKTKAQLATIRASERVAVVIASLRPASGDVDMSEIGL